MPRPRLNQRRIRGPYKHRNRWRVVVCYPGGETTPVSYSTREEAEAVVEAARRETGRVSVAGAIELWQKDLDSQGLKPVTVETAINKARLFCGPSLSQDLTSLTPKRCQALYQQLCQREDVAAQTQRHALANAKRLLTWCKEQGLIVRNGCEGIKPVGRPNRGKPQLRVTESRKLVDHCLVRSAEGDESAVAVAIALVFGRRASEVAELRVRDVDDGGALLWIAKAKTEAGKVVLEVPLVLRPVLVGLADARRRAGEERLFPGRTRYWLYYHAQRHCREAGVPVVCAHGLRGTHATIADQTGATAEMVIRAMGWTNIGVGDRHYFAPGSRDRTRAGRAADRLLGPGDENQN